MAELPHYRTILLATDGSEQAVPAARHALALARQTGAALEVVYVVDSHLAFRLGVLKDEAVRELTRDGERALQAVSEQAREAGVETETHLVEGRPGEDIVRESEDLDADLIVIGSHGQGVLTDILLGSVSQYVVHHARVPVCVVRPPPLRGQDDR
jgi:nucleotide-binding universal stress UspA family protein